jgi:hypothetical protein
MIVFILSCSQLQEALSRLRTLEQLVAASSSSSSASASASSSESPASDAVSEDDDATGTCGAASELLEHFAHRCEDARCPVIHADPVCALLPPRALVQLVKLGACLHSVSFLLSALLLFHSDRLCSTISTLSTRPRRSRICSARQRPGSVCLHSLLEGKVQLAGRPHRRHHRTAADQGAGRRTGRGALWGNKGEGWDRGCSGMGWDEIG